MLVTVEEAVAEDLLEEDLGRVLQDQPQIVAFRQEGRPVVKPDARHPLHGQDALGGIVPLDPGDAIAGVVGEVVRQLAGCRRFQSEVHLDLRKPAEEGNGLDRAKAAGQRDDPFEDRSTPGHQVDVPQEHALDTRAQDLHGDLYDIAVLLLLFRCCRRVPVVAVVFGPLGRRQGVPPADGGEMDLRQRGGGHRFCLEADEELRDRLAQATLHHALGFFAGEGRQPILQAGEILRQGVADQIGPGGQELPELDEGGAEQGQGAR